MQGSAPPGWTCYKRPERLTSLRQRGDRHESESAFRLISSTRTISFTSNVLGVKKANYGGRGSAHTDQRWEDVLRRGLHSDIYRIPRRSYGCWVETTNSRPCSRKPGCPTIGPWSSVGRRSSGVDLSAHCTPVGAALRAFTRVHNALA